MTKTQKNIVYNIVYQILIIILPLITAPYISRVLGVEKLGIYSYTYSIVNYFMLFAMLGVNNYGNREIANVREDKGKRSRIFWEIYSFQFIISLVVCFLYCTYIIIGVNSEYKWINSIQMLFVFSTVLDINWFFFGLGEFKITVTRNTLLKLISLILIFIFVKDKNDLYVYTIIMSLSACISQFSMWIIIKKYINFVKIKLKDIFKHVKPILILFIPVLSYSIYKIMDKIMLGNMSGMIDVGLYENAEKIINIPQGIITAIGTVMLSQISSIQITNKDEAINNYLRISFKYLSIVSIAISFGLMGIAEEFAPIFFGEEYRETGVIIKILAITIIFISWANIIRTQYLIPLKRDKVYVISTIIGGIINFIINILLIPILGIYGAAIGTVAAEFSVMFYQILKINKQITVKNYLKETIFFIINAIIMLFIINILDKFIYGNIISLISKILVGAFIYLLNAFIYLYINKDVYLLNILSKLKLKK